VGVCPRSNLLLWLRASKHLSEAVVVTGAEAGISWRKRTPARGAGAITVKGSESLRDRERPGGAIYGWPTIGPPLR